MPGQSRTGILVVATGLGVVLSIVFATALINASVPPRTPGAPLVIAPAGAVLHVSPDHFAYVPFTIFLPGVLIGGAEVDHESVFGIGVFPVGSAFSCPSEPAPPPSPPFYWGGPWSYSANQSLAPGSYFWGTPCGGSGNITVTQSVEIVFTA
jgi:hypothetical protein